MHANPGIYAGDDETVHKIMAYVISEFLLATGIDLRAEPTAMRRVSEAAVRAKADLEAFPQTSVNLPYIASDRTGAKHLDITITPAALNF